ncbi:MAG: sigma-70 family RNA polymerase sigma factor [Planctomycetes bacterium]|nr:sigma-70 family RNA polymerase sigma factor [Planctomycetota bacterium]
MDRETELMVRVKAASAEAFQELYALYRKPLANFFYRLCWNRSLVDDLVQEVFLRLWRAAPTYEPSAKPSTYIFRIAHNLWMNEAAKKKATVLEDLEHAIERDPSDDAQRDELRKAVRRAIEGLPEGERECLILSEVNGLRYAEIGEILGIPIGTVKSRIFNAVRRLREALEGMR